MSSATSQSFKSASSAFDKDELVLAVLDSLKAGKVAPDDIAAARRRAQNNIHSRARRQRFKAQGLTSAGKPYVKRHRNAASKSLSSAGGAAVTMTEQTETEVPDSRVTAEGRANSANGEGQASAASASRRDSMLHEPSYHAEPFEQSQLDTASAYFDESPLATSASDWSRPCRSMSHVGLQDTHAWSTDGQSVNPQPSDWGPEWPLTPNSNGFPDWPLQRQADPDPASDMSEVTALRSEVAALQLLCSSQQMENKVLRARADALTDHLLSASRHKHSGAGNSDIDDFCNYPFPQLSHSQLSSTFDDAAAIMPAEHATLKTERSNPHLSYLGYPLTPSTLPSLTLLGDPSGSNLDIVAGTSAFSEVLPPQPAGR